VAINCFILSSEWLTVRPRTHDPDKSGALVYQGSHRKLMKKTRAVEGDQSAGRSATATQAESDVPAMSLARKGASAPAGISFTSRNASVRLKHRDVDTRDRDEGQQQLKGRGL